MKSGFFSEKKDLFLGLILALALFLRILGIRFGLPNFRFHTDENFIIGNLIFMEKNRTLAPDNIVYPAPIYYFLLFFSSILKLTDQIEILLMGRIISAFLGTAGVYFLYLIVKDFFGLKTALISAFFLAINFLHVNQSHYFKVDVPGATLGLLSLFYISKILKENEKRNYLWAGLFSGLAFGTQYTQIFFIISFFVAHVFSFLKKSKSKSVFAFFNKNLAIFLIFSCLSFLISNPRFLTKLGNIFNYKEAFEKEKT